MSGRPVMGVAVAIVAAIASIAAQDLPRGRLIEEVVCVGDPSQTYALYIPSGYDAAQSWPLLIGFHPGARGRAIVERYQAAAERYGYIVAGSNNSRNGPMQVSLAAAQAMTGDLGRRFSLDPKRVYLTGLSGGARVALDLALGNNSKVAGVIASSAGYPDSQPRKSVPFAVFGTAGTEDFNYIEMRLLDRKLTSPHRLIVFEGGHTLPPESVAMQAIEWLDLQAMKDGRRPRDEGLIDAWLQAHQQAIATTADSIAVVHQLEALVDDFSSLRDISAASARLAALSKQPDVKKALNRERDDDDAEIQLMTDLLTLERGLKDDTRRRDDLSELRDRITRLAKSANATADSAERRRARRVLRSITMGASERVQDPEYLRFLEQIRPQGRGST